MIERVQDLWRQGNQLTILKQVFMSFVCYPVKKNQF